MFSIIDIETTGGNPKTDKITEIAIYVHDGDRIVRSYDTLINPERLIPYYITTLTGIDNKMVKDAPKFYEVAKDIVEFTENSVFIAHNVGFDFGFIAHEFQRLGYNYQRKKLCTVKLSRKLLPGMGSYSLGKLSQALGIEIKARHRAAGDALATVKLFEILVKKDNNRLIKRIGDQNNATVKIAAIPNELIGPLPEEAGVYYFFDDENNLIYIGKSKNIRARVISHFNATTGKKAVEMQQKIKRIDFEITGSELIALLKESEEIKTELPIYNRAQRRSLFNYGLFVSLELDGYLHLRAARIAKNRQPITTFYSLAEAKNTLRRLCDEHELCLKHSGLYLTEGACFYHQINRCKGACLGLEEAEQYNARVELALEHFKYHSDNLIIIDQGRTSEEKSLVLVKNGQYLGFGFFDPSESAIDPTTAMQIIDEKRDNRDIHQIIRTYLKKNSVEHLIRF